MLTLPPPLPLPLINQKAKCGSEGPFLKKKSKPQNTPLNLCRNQVRLFESVKSFFSSPQPAQKGQRLGKKKRWKLINSVPVGLHFQQICNSRKNII